jgi:CubicO group peptidase (beta-lactamase class C family)
MKHPIEIIRGLLRKTPLSQPKNHRKLTVIRLSTVPLACLAGAALGVFSPLEAHGALVPVNPPNFNMSPVGYYGSWVYPNGGWILISGNPGDGNSNPCATANGAVVQRTGMYSATGMNLVETGCSPNYYWFYAGYGTDPLGWAFSSASSSPTDGYCFFNVTMGENLRTKLPAAVPPVPATATHYPRPSGEVPFSFNVNTFVNNLRNTINSANPAPVGWQLAVRAPNGDLVYNSAFGSVTGDSPLSETAMTTTRRFDTASMSKTVTATAMLAAIEDMQQHQPQLDITLDSSIAPFLPSNWDRSKVSMVTFRSLLRHTSGFVANGGDTYAALKTMVESGPNLLQIGKWTYYNGNYALMRILIPYLTDGPQAYQPFESDPTQNAQITAMSYRNYVRGKVFDPIGLAAVDDFYTGPLPETIYFNASRVAIGDSLNIAGSSYNQTANNMVLTAGAGNWTLSAAEFSWFISCLWRGQIISQASLTEMVPQMDSDPSQDRVGIGMYASRVNVHGADWYNYNHGGGGWAGGPQGIWMTFFNGYTAVFLNNTASGLNRDTYRVIEDSFLPALTYTLQIKSAVYNKATGNFSLSWVSQPGATYTIERSSDMRFWTKVKTGHPSDGALTTYTDNPGAGGARRVYRVVYE